MKGNVNYTVSNCQFSSARARCAIYSRDTAIRIYSVPRFKTQKSVCQNLHHGTKLWASQNIFAGHYLLIFPNMAIS